ncbi:hypothetical protein HPP92_006709 [Vanilla planifolia]|uniref:Uncharacterized protein n=1 Tax=Vanilla planifolia TaxID=51239 RepID=A0A835RCM3_VANPL|nr:hypothetical protein HPP92_006982 [Vanilla planifolia]KAG0489846.1 hypothetical protein HPP92_006709 [Vanilla planifolia]
MAVGGRYTDISYGLAIEQDSGLFVTSSPIAGVTQRTASKRSTQERERVASMAEDAIVGGSGLTAVVVALAAGSLAIRDGEQLATSSRSQSSSMIDLKRCMPSGTE